MPTFYSSWLTKKMAEIQSVGKNVDCDIDAKCYVKSFNSSKLYSVWNFIASCLFDHARLAWKKVSFLDFSGRLMTYLPYVIMCNKVPRGCQNWFTITRFHYIEVLFLIVYYYWDKQKELVTYRFVISRLHRIILPGANFQLYLENERLWYPWIRPGRDVLLNISAYKAIQKRNQRAPMATHGLIIIKMKADVELAITLPVYFKSVKKWRYVLRKNKTKQD